MKKMKVTFVVVNMALIAATSLTACDMLPFGNQQNQQSPQNSMIEKVSTVFSGESSSAAMQLDAKIEMTIKEGFSKQSMEMELDCVENIKAKTADFTMKVTENNNQAKAVYQNLYMRGEDVYKTEAYSAGEEALGLIPIKNVDDMFNEYFSGLDMEFELDLEGGADTASEIYSLLMFGEEYNAIETKGSVLTFDVSELFYNIVTSLKPAYNKIDTTTKVREYFEEKSVKNLIDALAGDDSALDIYNNLMKENSSSSLSEYFELVEDFKPNKNQSLYDYVLYLLDSEDFVEETEYASIARQGQSLGELRIYEILYKHGNAEKILNEMRSAQDKATKENVKIVTMEDSVSAYVALENMEITFELDGDKAKGLTLMGGLEIGVEGDDIQKQSVNMTFELEADYLAQAQQIRDLMTMNYAKEALFFSGYTGLSQYLAPNTMAYIKAVLAEDKTIENVEIVYNGENITTVYKPALGAYAYTLNGYDMLVWAENVPSDRKLKKGQLKYVICFDDEAQTPFNVYVKNSDVAETGYYYVSYEDYQRMQQDALVTLEGINYRMHDDGKSYIVMSLADRSKKHVEIKSEVNGLPVKVIDSNAFFSSSVESVKIPSSIIEMNGAFKSRTTLQSVEIHCPTIDAGAFEGCLSLETVDLIGVNRIKGGAFSNLKNLKNISFGDQLVIVGDNAFAGCENAQIVLPSSLQYIGQNAFKGCAKLAEVNLENVVEIQSGAFDNCSGIKKVRLGKYVSNISRLFCDHTSLEEIIIPSGVTTIGYAYFEGCESLKKIELPDGFKEIGPYAFHRCLSLTSVVISDSVTSIGVDAFYNCGNLTNVYYKGTVEEWAKISIDDGNSHLIAATRYYYSETEPTGEGNYWHYDENGEVVVWTKETV